MTKVERFVLVFIIVITALVFVFWRNITGNGYNNAIASSKQEQKSNTKNDEKNRKDDKEEVETTDPAIRVTRKWEMPEDLKEISGIAPINDRLIACVQDELGRIFI